MDAGEIARKRDNPEKTSLFCQNFPAFLPVSLNRSHFFRFRLQNEEVSGEGKLIPYQTRKKSWRGGEGNFLGPVPFIFDEKDIFSPCRLKVAKEWGKGRVRGEERREAENFPPSSR